MQEEDSVSGASEPAAPSADAVKLQSQRNRCAGWFSAVAAFSIINLLVLAFGGGVNFLIGLGATQVIDGLCQLQAQRLAPPAALALRLIGGGATVCIAGMFFLFGVMARRGYWWAFVVGMAMYAVDGLIFLWLKDWLSLGFHAFVLLMLAGGVQAQLQLNRLEKAAREGPSVVAPQE